MRKTMMMAGAMTAAVLLVGCAAQPLPVESAAAMPSAYTLGAGDKLRITTFGFEEFSGEFMVAADDSLAMPMLGTVPVRDVTPDQLSRKLEAALGAKGLVRQPRVSTEVTKYRPYYISGEVNRPGKYDFASGLTVMQAVADAGSFTYRAKKKMVFIKRAGAPAEVAVPVTASAPVLPGDTIRVVERYF